MNRRVRDGTEPDIDPDDALEIVDLEDARDGATDPAAREPAGYGGAPRRSRRRVAVGAVAGLAVLAVVVGILAVPQPDDDDDPETAIGLPDDTETGSAPTTVPLPDLPDGPVLPGGIGRLLIAGRAGLTLLDGDTGALDRPVDGASERAAILARSGDRVLLDVGDSTRLVDLTGARSTIAFESGTEVLPALEAGNWWMVADGRIGAVDDKRTTRAIPDGVEVLGAVRGGFLVRTADTGTLAHWDDEGDTVRPLTTESAEVVAVHPHRIAWLGPECALLRCVLHVTDVGSGTDALVSLGLRRAEVGATFGAAGRFSPDGDRLAVLVRGAEGAPDLVLTDLADGSVQHWAGPTLDFPAGATATGIPAAARPLSFDWLPDGRRVIGVVPEAKESRVVAYSVDGTVEEAESRLTGGSSLVALDLPVADGPPEPVRPIAPLLPDAPPTVLAAQSYDEPGRLALLDLASGTVIIHTLASRPDGLVANDFDSGPWLAATRGGFVAIALGEAWWIPRGGTPVSVGPADGVVGSTLDEVWLVRSANGPEYELVRVDGRNGETRSVRTVHTWGGPAMRGGIVEYVQPTLDEPGSITLFDPESGRRRVLRDDEVIVGAAGTTLVSGAGPCFGDRGGGPESCVLIVTDISSGRSRRLDGVSGSVTLSPDGRFMVVSSFLNTPVEPGEQFVVVDAGTGDEIAIPASAPQPAGASYWSSSGMLLFDTQEGLAVWKPGDTEITMLPDVGPLSNLTVAVS